MTERDYGKLVNSLCPESPMGKDCIWAFCIGGGICTLAQGLREIYMRVCTLPEEDAGTLTSVTLVFLAVLLTGIGVFDNIAKHAGAGTLVPITGFANAVVSPAIDSHAEGLILGVGAKIFTVAGPVLLYGTLAGAVWGVIYWVIGLF